MGQYIQNIPDLPWELISHYLYIKDIMRLDTAVTNRSLRCILFRRYQTIEVPFEVYRYGTILLKNYSDGCRRLGYFLPRPLEKFTTRRNIQLRYCEDLKEVYGEKLCGKV
jgi:hypothetical protein